MKIINWGKGSFDESSIKVVINIFIEFWYHELIFICLDERRLQNAANQNDINTGRDPMYYTDNKVYYN